MIGDNPMSDIDGGNRKEWTTILVETGVFNPDDKRNVNGNDPKNPATFVVHDFKAAIKLIFELEDIKVPKSLK